MVGITSPRLSNGKADSLWQRRNRFESCPDYNKRVNSMKLEEQIGVFIVIGFVIILFIIGVAIFDKDKN